MIHKNIANIIYFFTYKYLFTSLLMSIFKMNNNNTTNNNKINAKKKSYMT